MSYQIIFDEKAIDFLEKLDKNTRVRIFKKILSTKQNPFRYFEKLTKRDLYKLRIGDYRVIADINKKDIKILIVFIGHRKNIYEKN